MFPLLSGAGPQGAVVPTDVTFVWSVTAGHIRAKTAGSVTVETAGGIRSETPPIR